MDVMNRLSAAVSCLEGLDFYFKPKQVQILEAVHEGFDVMGILPTGFGKSLCFQLLPSFMKKKTDNLENIVVVAAPLNAILKDQLESMRSKGLRAEILQHSRDEEVIPSLFNADPRGEIEGKRWPTNIVKADFSILIAHPESLLGEKTLELFRTEVYQKRVCAIVVDEAHLIHNW